MRILWLLLLLPSLAGADTFYFGGARSTKGVLDRCYPLFRNIPDPWSNVDAVIAEINRPENRGKAYTVIGHSSGAQAANRVASRAINPGRITLVDADGFAPVGVPKAVRRICLRAVNGKLRSRNFWAMTQANGCQEIRTVTAPQCLEPWCLHFSTVNLNAPANLSNGRWVAAGYNHCALPPELR